MGIDKDSASYCTLSRHTFPSSVALDGSFTLGLTPLTWFMTLVDCSTVRTSMGLWCDGVTVDSSESVKKDCRDDRN